VSQPKTHYLKQHCPNCSKPARIRSRTPITRTCDDLYFVCLDNECGATWKAQLVVVHMISPGLCPRADLNLPAAPLRQRLPTPANDERPRVPAVTPRIANNDEDSASVAV